jgi:prophage antirepressor-like protein
MTSLIQFGLNESEIVQKDGTFYLPVSTLSSILHVSSRNIRQVINRHIDEFDDGTGNLMRPIPTSTGEKEGYLLSEHQVYLLCMLLRRSEKAKLFRKALTEFLVMVRKKEFVHISELKAVQLELGLTQEKLFMKIEKASKKRVDRYFQLRAIGLSTVEAARAVKLRARPSARLEKTKALIAASQQPIKILEGL